MSRPPHQHKPPMLDGVSASCVALPHGPWPRLIDFLGERLPKVGMDEWQQRMAQNRVLDEQGVPQASDAPYRPGTRIYYYRELETEALIPFEEEVLYQDEHLLVADKPHFLPVTPSGRYVQQTLLVRLKRRTGLEHLSPIHRIDRETAGLVLFSLRPQDRGAYQALFREQVVDKDYEAIAPLRPDLPLPAVHRSRIEADEQFFRQREVPGAPNSETQIALLEARGTLARYRLRPRSGKTHQLRVHMDALGRPIVGDLFYPEVVHGPGPAQEDWSRPLQLLARGIRFSDPVTGALRQFESRRQLVWPADA
ncbi:pseudouridine synthase [Rhodoferax sp. BAB1]|uniref:pseudouridine synthase n=1 Tax=Rhodoferax sp. BAB1 TaxID=2741720 RepID=UPI001575F443|nr:pseudouridine synthase [Rhodoferax sp. BAB1]QKO21384.1 pseudouridine synthase [Rhodoferax sp. BAB1]